jgi:cell cycle arrest protein BUB2
MRPFIWSIFLNVSPHSPAKYISHLSHGPSPLAHKIRNDTPRTLATDPLFRKRVTEGMLRRILNAFDWSMSKRNKGIRYVQGMNVLAAPFLYVCGGEAECMAFGLFEKFITIECPVYVRPTLEGVHRGLKVCAFVADSHSTSCLTFVFTELNQSCIITFAKRNSKPSCTPFPVSPVVNISDLSCPHLFRLYASPLRSLAFVGFPLGIRRTHEHPRNNIPNHHPAR